MLGLLSGDLPDVENGICKVFCVVLRVGGIVGTQELRSPNFYVRSGLGWSLLHCKFVQNLPETSFVPLTRTYPVVQ
jgi:hypothetical protein